jgi:hypothetical protein
VFELLYIDKRVDIYVKETRKNNWRRESRTDFHARHHVGMVELLFGPVEWKRVIYTRAENNESFSYMTLTWLLSALEYCIIIIK